jgi:DNA-binding NtrC family response regulator
MKKIFTILVADRNPHIRDFVQRELKEAGHRVFTAKNAAQLKGWILRPIQMDALVIDPNIPGMDNYEELRLLLTLRPELPVVFHCFVPDTASLRDLTEKVVFVEKSGHSIDAVKEKIEWLLTTPKVL